MSSTHTSEDTVLFHPVNDWKDPESLTIPIIGTWLKEQSFNGDYPLVACLLHYRYEWDKGAYARVFFSIFSLLHLEKMAGCSIAVGKLFRLWIRRDNTSKFRLISMCVTYIVNCDLMRKVSNQVLEEKYIRHLGTRGLSE